MKSVRIIIFSLIILSPSILQAGSGSLLDKIDGAWYDKIETIFIVRDRNKFLSINGAKMHEIPWINHRQMGNVLFFEDPAGKKRSIRYMNSEMISFIYEEIDHEFIMYRWHFTADLLDKLQGAWYNNDATIIFDFKNKKETIVLGTNTAEFEMRDIQHLTNVCWYNREDLSTEFVHLIGDDMITTFTKGDSKYGLFFRWNENQ